MHARLVCGRRFLVTAIAMGCGLTVVLGAVAYSRDDPFFPPAVSLPSGQWFLRFEDWSYNERSSRIELQSNGDVRALIGSKWERPWTQTNSGRLPLEDRIKAYDAARKLLQDIRLADRSERTARDYDGGYEVTLVTAERSFRFWVVGSETDAGSKRDKLLADDLERLRTIVVAAIRPDKKTDNVKGQAKPSESDPPHAPTKESAPSKADQPKALTQGPSIGPAPLETKKPKQPAKAQPRWIVVVEDQVIDSTQQRSPHEFRLKIFEAAAGDPRLVFNRQLGRDAEKEVQPIVAALRNRFELPPLHKMGLIAPSSTPPSLVQFVIRQETNNRRLDIRFGIEEAQRLGVEREIKKLISLANARLEIAGKGTPIQIAAPK